MRKTYIFTFIVLLSLTGSVPVENIGIASWYGGSERLNRYTANGEIFDPDGFTCASWDYPLGTKLRVTNVVNNKNVIVRVNDRGPNKRFGRAIDLTKNAFKNIECPKKGLVMVKIEKIK